LRSAIAFLFGALSAELLRQHKAVAQQHATESTKLSGLFNNRLEIERRIKMGAAVQNGRILSASTLIGDPVRNRKQQELGSIKELMIDTEEGRVAYAVVSCGGVLGLGEKLFAVPWSAFEICREEKCLVLDVAQSQLEQAPGFDKDNWPDMIEPEWQEEVHLFYLTQPQASGGAARNRK
jgi:sporulation protein YlmC with PRC-barrel domain